MLDVYPFDIHHTQQFETWSSSLLTSEGAENSVFEDIKTAGRKDECKFIGP